MKKIRSVLIILTAASIINTSLLVGCGNYGQTKNIENYINLMEIDNSYYLKNNDKYYIKDFDENRPIIIVLKGFEQKEVQIANEILSELNMVFSQMNSGINLEAKDYSNYSFSKKDRNVIVCESVLNLAKENTAGIAFVESNCIQIYSEYKIKNRTSYGGQIFLHEVLHFFGLGDAYLVNNCQTQSVMHEFYDPYKTNFLSSNDIKMLASIYGNFKNQEDIDNFLIFANNYGVNTINPIERID